MPNKTRNTGLALALNPAQVTMLSFAALCLFGTLILMLPVSNSNGEWRDWVSAMFMSVSAVCVTGLAVVDVGREFSIWGQTAILILMQIGGLSYMTFTTIFIYMVGKKLSFSDTKIFDMSNNSESKIDFTSFVIRIGLFTIIIEGIGFLFLLVDSFKSLGLNLDPSSFSDLKLVFQGLFYALFHAVSAFCNAGLSLYSSSLEGFRDNYWMLWMFSILPIIGGLGYTVLTELHNWFTAYMKNKQKDRFKFSLSLHTKVSLTATAVLLVSGILIQLYLIYAQDLANLTDFWDNLWVAFFQSCSARSSGFNSIPLTELGDPSLAFLIVWMFFGACPGGTGGGIKVTTLVLVLAIIWAGLKNNKDVKIFNRSVNESYQKRALIVFISTSIFIIIFTGLISLFESGQGQRFIDQLFEVTSAFTTVGLSAGITTSLSDPSLIVLCICMVIGRPGPLLFLMSIITEDPTRKPHYPEEGILIG